MHALIAISKALVFKITSCSKLYIANISAFVNCCFRPLKAFCASSSYSNS
jgi:hypothetical protein